MAIYAIGDVQGCYDELARLIDKLHFDPGKDELWFVGDLVNRGPRSLETLRYICALGTAATVTLGNHDLHLLARSLEPHRADKSLAPILAAPDADELLHWLRHQPLAAWHAASNTLMVHAGVNTNWDAEQTIRHAGEVERELQGENWQQFLAEMYGRQPDLWSPDLTGIDRLRYITNCLTRIRFCARDGRLDFDHKGPPGQQPDTLLPWFDMPGRASEAVRVVFGHWSALGLLQRRDLLMIDTGCVWGRTLTAVRLDGSPTLTSVAAIT